MGWLKEKFAGMLGRLFKPNFKEVSTWTGLFKLATGAGVITAAQLQELPLDKVQGIVVTVLAVLQALLGALDYLRKEIKK